MGTIQRLENWYKAQCNGHWEHGRGIRICTLDNPGWSVTINLSETTEADQLFEAIKIEASETDWLQCWKQGTEFEGRGDASKLEAILGRFLTLVGY